MEILSDLTFCELRLMLLAKSWYMVTQRAPVGTHNLEKMELTSEDKIKYSGFKPKTLNGNRMVYSDTFSAIPHNTSYLFHTKLTVYESMQEQTAERPTEF